MSKKLADIRKRIDTLDDKIHDLLMQRADLIMDVAEEKRKNNIQIVHPDREAKMVRRLIKRHQGPLPESAILSIWRELVGAVCMMQTGLSVVVADTPDFHEHWDMAKNYFGSVLPISKVSTSLMAVASVRDNDASFAVVPWPNEGVDTGDENPWWVHAYNARDKKMRIVCALPYGYDNGSNFMSVQPKAMVISKIEFLESGDDHSCLVLETDSSVSRGRIVDELKKIDIEPFVISTKSTMNSEQKNLHLIIVNGFMDTENKKIRQIEKVFVGSQCVLLGGYPVPPKLKPVKSNV